MPKQGPHRAGAAEQSTRERIVQAAVDVMADIGIDGVRTRAVAERAGVNQALVHYHFHSVSALVLEAAEHAMRQALEPAIEALTSGDSVQDGIRALLTWIEKGGQRAAGARILADAMVKATRDPEFRRWTRYASRRFRGIILERLTAAYADHELDRDLDLEATAVLLAAAFDGLLFHRLVDPKVDVVRTAGPIAQMLGSAEE